MNNNSEKINRKKLFSIIILIILGLLLTYNFRFIPEKSLSVKDPAARYIKSGVKETGALNVVTAILYDYRAFDSLGESTVIFAAVSGIVLVLSRKTLPVSSHGLTFIVKRTFGILTPFIFLYSLYLITHAHLSPGGGFQGGVILGAISIIFCIVYGSEFDYRRYSPKMKTVLETGGALIFVLMGILGIIFENGFLDNLNFIGGETGSLISAGSIPIINLGIGFKVGAGLAIIFYSMIQKTFEEEEEAGH
ncbi:MAG: hydrogen gas-evolving membrane-bound hydrogenase subunit E [Bacillota bacterium]